MEKKCQYFVMKIAALVFRRSLEIRFQFFKLTIIHENGLM